MIHRLVLLLEPCREDRCIMSKGTLKILFVDEKRITSDLEKAGYRKIGAHISQAPNFGQAKDMLLKEAA